MELEYQAPQSQRKHDNNSRKQRPLRVSTIQRARGAGGRGQGAGESGPKLPKLREF